MAAEPVYERYAWILFAIIGILTLAIAIGDVVLGAGGDPATTEAVTGISWGQLQATDPAVANLVDLHARVVGVWLMGFALVTILIAATAYRHGRRWAWYAFWSWPLVAALVFLLYFVFVEEGTPPPLYSSPAILALSLAGLLLPLRRFFPVAGRA